MGSIGDLPSEPIYTIQMVSQKTGIQAVTLRMWERRYAILTPARSAGNYRLYSDREVALLRWLKREVDSGTPIRQAAAQLESRLAHQEWPPVLPELRSKGDPHHQATRLARELFKALMKADEGHAGRLLRQAHASLDLDSLCLRVLTPCLVEVGEAWHRGEIRIAQEHFASGFLRGHLLSLYQAYPLRRGAPRAFVGCAPSEQHEIGALMLAVLMRRGGVRVDYLGANLEPSDLLAYVRDQRPALVALSAASEPSALALAAIADGLARLRPRPALGFGGRAFDQVPSLRTELKGRFLGEDAAVGARAAIAWLQSGT
jgi:MerR family transcriptional regulator, light-induced transcriptional regulator